MSKSATIEALAKILAKRLTWTEDAPQIAAAIEEAIYRNGIPGIAKRTNDGTTCWMCPVCHKTRDGKRCVTCLEAERDAFKKSLNSAKAATYRAMVVMGLGTEPDDGPDGRWPCGTDVIDALIAEHAKFKESLAKTEAERDALRAELGAIKRDRTWTKADQAREDAMKEYYKDAAAPVAISEDVDERMDRLHALAERFVSAYETMADSGIRGESEDHFWSAREECMNAMGALEAASLLVGGVGGWKIVGRGHDMPGPGPVLVATKGGEVYVAVRDDGVNENWLYWPQCALMNNSVTHWMPLPLPPKELKP